MARNGRQYSNAGWKAGKGEYDDGWNAVGREKKWWEKEKAEKGKGKGGKGGKGNGKGGNGGKGGGQGNDPTKPADQKQQGKYYYCQGVGCTFWKYHAQMGREEVHCKQCGELFDPNELSDNQKLAWIKLAAQHEKDGLEVPYKLLTPPAPPAAAEPLKDMEVDGTGGGGAAATDDEGNGSVAASIVEQQEKITSLRASQKLWISNPTLVAEMLKQERLCEEEIEKLQQTEETKEPSEREAITEARKAQKKAEKKMDADERKKDEADKECQRIHRLHLAAKGIADLAADQLVASKLEYRQAVEKVAELNACPDAEADDLGDGIGDDAANDDSIAAQIQAAREETQAACFASCSAEWQVRDAYHAQQLAAVMELLKKVGGDDPEKKALIDAAVTGVAPPHPTPPPIESFSSSSKKTGGRRGAAKVGPKNDKFEKKGGGAEKTKLGGEAAAAKAKADSLKNEHIVE